MKTQNLFSFQFGGFTFHIIPFMGKINSLIDGVTKTKGKDNLITS